MATPQSFESAAGQKRGAEEAQPTATPVAKKPKLASPDEQQAAPANLSPAISTGTPTIEKRSTKLPTKIADSKPLPTLRDAQAPKLSDSEYQTIAASAVLTTSIARSQARWTAEGIFQRYWTKPETGKNARPPPPNNPDSKWMKHKGECRVRVEPHIFECQMYLEEKPRPPPPPKTYVQPAPTGQSAYGPAYRPQQPYQQPYAQQQSQYGLGHSAPLVQQPAQNVRTLPTVSQPQQRPPSQPPVQQPRPPPPTPPPQQGQKANPDPVIGRLAARASSNPELKTLMKEVAAGNANPQQLQVFQRHIDELQRQIKEEKETRMAEEQKAREAEAGKSQTTGDVIQYDGAADPKPSTPRPLQHPQQQQHPPPPQRQPIPVHHAHPQPHPAPQQPYIPPPPQPPAVILSFSIPGATEDRFLFPRDSILEKLSEHHYLASFIVTLQGREAAEPSLFNPDTKYWQPVTIMLEVKYGLEGLVEHVMKWVRPAHEVRKNMEQVMNSCEKAPDMSLAIRLPVKGSSAAGVEGADESSVSKEATPVVAEEKLAAKKKSNVKYVKPPLSSALKKKTESASQQSTPSAASKKKEGEGKRASLSGPAPLPATVAAEKEQKGTAAAEASKDSGEKKDVEKEGGNSGKAENTDNGRPKRSTRKSVRISEG
ncbi:hypothetical protein B0A50_01675 [Salinomyces thailandicus]|uniref:SWR1-complex protein 3 domain-containing protein n=1 Tax=Salinomyces thailandicus TaxID=706561 RepID=A0A4U0UBM3_9PEZI|nr:hypothetical protein B0A50_01675 [Salinomyces thailandica]